MPRKKQGPQRLDAEAQEAARDEHHTCVKQRPTGGQPKHREEDRKTIFIFVKNLPDSASAEFLMKNVNVAMEAR